MNLQGRQATAGRPYLGCHRFARKFGFNGLKRPKKYCQQK
jgi:hypothetical protein